MGARVEAVVKQVDTTGVWRMFVEGVQVCMAEGGELMMS